jgi:outer membrane protein OmpA-like peptidoglycan-associated protein
MRNYLLLLLFFFAVLPIGLQAQNSKLKKAAKYMDVLQYEKAIPIYLGILEKDSNAVATMQLAEAYRRSNDYANAEVWYARAVELPMATPLHRYYYGLMLQRNGKCHLAEASFKEFLKYKPYDHRRAYLENACTYQEELMTKISGIIDVRLPGFNSPQNDLGPAFYKEGIVFASTRKGNIDDWDDEAGFLDLYYIPANVSKGEEGMQFVYGTSEEFSGKLNSSRHEAIVTFNKEQNQIFFTRNRKVKRRKREAGIVNLEIMSAKKVDEGKWTDLEPLPFNSDAYSVAHPSLSADGKRLFFSSDMPGGFGGKDLYVSFYEDNQWGPPINLGPKINTEGDELYPYYEPSGVLYFASDGHFGLGGQDIYKAEDRGLGEWGAPDNMGYPINTIADDFGIIIADGGSYGFFTSNRPGGRGKDDVYSFVRTDVYLQLQLSDAEDGLALAGTKISNDCFNNTRTTDKDGKLKFNMRLNECCRLEASLDGYEMDSIEICSKDVNPGDTLFVNLQLKKEIKLQVSGIVFDQITGMPLEGAVIKLVSEDCEVETPLVSDGGGQYLFPLQEGCCYKLRAEKGNYFSKTIQDEICLTGDSPTVYTANLGLQPFVRSDEVVATEKPMPNYGRVEEATFKVSRQRDDNMEKTIAYKLNIYYDFGRTSIREEAVEELQRLYTLLQDNPGLVLEISSHTDARGSAPFNERLSQRRANKVIQWLIAQGIPKKRLIAKGYGETMLVNNCADGTSCTEEEHQQNRRTEFRVVGQLEDQE